ncbi:MAG: sulfotransferase domain-containing protein [Novosphingobium sp.]
MDQPLFDPFNREADAERSALHDDPFVETLSDCADRSSTKRLDSDPESAPPVLRQPANWIVSFPRSGNTFVRSLLANYASGLDRPLTMAELTAASWGEHAEHLLTPLTGKQPKDRSLQDEWRVRPAYFEEVRTRINPRMPMIKSHTPVGAVKGLPAFDFAPGDKVIHIVRHPCDVVVSVADYYNFTIDQSIAQVLKRDTCYYGAPENGYELVGSWSQHTRSWINAMPVPLARLTYRALVENPVGTLLELVTFLGLEPDQYRAGQAAEFCKFKRLKSAAQAEGFSETAKTARQGYFREGRPGQWLDKLTVNQARAVLDDDPELIAYFGFSTLSLS